MRPSRLQGELRALTGMRGIAAWLVVAYHLRAAPAGLPDVVVRMLAKGYLAVDFFFLLSGFVIWMSWSERLRTRGFGEVPLFLKRRVARIWPLHLAMLGFALVLAGVIVATGRSLPPVFPLAALPAHVLLVQDWGVVDPLAWNDPAWSISAELGAYLLFPFVAIAIDWRRLSPLAMVGVIAGLIALLHLLFVRAGATTLGFDIARLGLVRCIVEFTIGGAICSLWSRTSRHETEVAVGSVVLAVAAAGATLAGWLPETIGVPAAFSAGLLALALSSAWSGNPLASAPLHWLGEISYATYLSHYLIWFAVKLALPGEAHDLPPLTIAAYAATVLAASALLYHWFEKPAQRAINAWSPASRKPHPAS